MTVKMRVALFCRSLFLNACWGFERMQGPGLGWSLSPWLERRGAPGAMGRHLEYFSTNPYLSGFAIGMIVALEERGESPQRIAGLKKSAASTLAGIGDALFWGALRPFAAIFGLSLGALIFTVSTSEPGVEKAAVAGASAFLAAFTVPALAMRWLGIGLGYGWGDKLPEGLAKFPWQRVIRGVRLFGCGLVLCCAGIGMLAAIGPPGRGAGAWALFAGFAAVAAGSLARAKGLSVHRLYGLVAAACVGLAALGWRW